MGLMLSGKTFISNLLVKHCSFTLTDLKVFEEKIKKSKGTEEEPFDGEVDSMELAMALKKAWEEDLKKGLNSRYIIDNINVLKNPNALF